MRSTRTAVVFAAAVAAVTALSACASEKPDSVLSPTGSGMTSSSTPLSAGTPGDQPGDAPLDETATDPDTSASSDPTANPPTSAHDDEATADPTSSGEAPRDHIMPPQDAAKTALERYSDGGVVSIELEREQGVTVWEVEIVTTDDKYEVNVDVVTGDIVSDKADHTSELTKYHERLEGAALDYREAIEAVLAAHDGSTLIEIQLDTEDGRLVWEAEVLTSDHVKYDIDLDAISGDVLSNKIDD